MIMKKNWEGPQEHGSTTCRVEVKQSVSRNAQLSLGKLRKVQKKYQP